MKRFLAPILRLLAVVFEFLLIRARSKRVRDARRAADAVRKASATGDAKTLNQEIEDARLDGVSKKGAARPVLLAGLLLLGGGLLLLPACTRTTLVVPADREIVSMEREVIPGFFVPRVVMAELSEAYVIQNKKGSK
jgi:hypothetical protein